MRSNGVRKNKKTNKEQDEDCVEDVFQFTRDKFDRNDERGREAVGKGYFGINI